MQPRERHRDPLSFLPPLGRPGRGFLLDQVLAHLGPAAEECFFWVAHSGAEIDCQWVRGGRRRGFEFRRMLASIMTCSAKTAFELPGLQNIFIIHAGDEPFPLPARVTTVAAGRMLSSGDDHMDT